MTASPHIPSPSLPALTAQLFDGVATALVFSRNREYKAIADEIHVRVHSVPIVDSLRDLRQVHLNALVKVSGVVTRRTGVHPMLRIVRNTCGRCGYLTGPLTVTDSSEAARPPSCPECQSPGPFTQHDESTVYGNWQSMDLQESPGSVLPGRTPRSKKASDGARGQGPRGRCRGNGSGQGLRQLPGRGRLQ